MTSFILGLAFLMQSPDLPPAPYFADSTPEPAQWAITSRIIQQDQGDWDVQYSIRNVGSIPRTVSPSSVAVSIDGSVSNSAAQSHVRPLRSSIKLDGNASPTAFADVIPSENEDFRCRERAVIQLRGSGDDPWPGRVGDPEQLPTLTVQAGDWLAVRLRLEHEHALYGEYGTLLGHREITLSFGGASVRDVLPLDREQYRAMPKDRWPEIPEEHRDTERFVSAPDSLFLDSEIPSCSYFRWPERKVRYSAKMKLSFWYFIMKGTDGQFKARVAQYRESKNSWKPLHDGDWQEELKVVGKWVKIQRFFVTEDEANTLALDFRLANSDLGLVFIDDVELEPVGNYATNDQP